MEPFTKVERRYRDFTLLANVDTALGFKARDLIIFKESGPTDGMREKDIVAVSQVGSNQIEIGQVFYNPIRRLPAHYRIPKDSERTLYIRLWNNHYDEYFRQFDIHGILLRPSQNSWQVRFSEQRMLKDRCCPIIGCKPCYSIVPCDFDCPDIIPMHPESAESKKKRELDKRITECWSQTRANCSREQKSDQEQDFSLDTRHRSIPWLQTPSR
ncbi:MAG: hypothetical protein HQM09_22550 [Candidatus Riflebacteria bacterium]|nr:hypothetical protein [Candidatus Riflebacteria bacterium]